MHKQLLQGASLAPLSLAAQRVAEETTISTRITRRGFSIKEIGQALEVLMSDPKATRPSWRAVRKTILRIRKGLDVSKGGWRSWPNMGEVHYAI
jgi:hypothetical protein